MIRRLFTALCLWLSLAGLAVADEYRPGYLELQQTDNNMYHVLWKVPTSEDNGLADLALRWSDDVRILTAPRRSYNASATIERFTITRDGGLTGAVIAIDGLDTTPTDVLVRVEHEDGMSETMRLNSSRTEYTIQGVPQFLDVVYTYMLFGIEHILEGVDHLLFVACLIFIAGTGRRILITITGFTLAHSVTLTLAALELVHVPILPIEAVIALSIVFLAREILLNDRQTLTWRHPITVSASFGLLHGFGFASALTDMGLPQNELPAALLSFNIGVELGQLLFVAVVLLLTRVAVRSGLTSRAWRYAPQTVITYGIGILAGFWTVMRIADFWI
ncbi:HupE/UreJ family protein [Ferrimonas pelagia]|uniref:HupE/UreJ family protein n=1 Tax=Ferrimonas pelagia TaxID=1177826 RepID=A0ABP9F6A5_9GAMM